LSDAEKSLFSFGKESFLSCLFSLQPCNITEDIKWFYSLDLGNCFQFNSIPPLKKTILQGELNGLSLTIGPILNSNQNNLNPFSVKGLRLYINEDNHMPTRLDECIFVSPHKQVKVSMKKVVSRNQPKPYTNCEDLDSLEYESDLVKYFKSTSRVYKQQNCLDLCYQRLTIDKCKCHIVGLPLYKSSRICGSLSDFVCYTDIAVQFISNINTIKVECLKDCPLECDSVSYDVEMSSLDIETNAELFTRFNKSIEQYRDFVSLNIYFANLKYTQIEQTPKTSVIELISNLGGALGIFLGFSVFSLIEIVEVIAQVIIVLVKSKK